MNSDHRLTPSERAQVEKWLATEPEFRNVRANYGKLRADFEKMYSDHRLTPSERAQVQKWLATEPKTSGTRNDDHEEQRIGEDLIELYSGQVLKYYRQRQRLLQLVEQPPPQADGVRQILQQWRILHQQQRQLEELRRLRTITKMQAIQVQAVEDKDRLLTSFLFRDNSFLTPWNWDPENRSAQGERIVFEPGSFFSHDEPVTR